MAEPQQFASQQSEIVINVSENHSSAKSSPQAAAALHVKRSPSIRATPSEECIPESSAAERVEDSYQESLRNTVPAELVEDDEEEEEEDLYTVSPNAKAKLEKTIAEVKRTEEEQVC